MSVCRYCERKECDTDCCFADSHTNAPERLTAAQWRARGTEQAHADLERLRAALREACDLGQTAVACASERERSTVRGIADRLDALRALADPQDGKGNG